MPDSLFCPHCGAENDTKATACFACGHDLHALPYRPGQPNRVRVALSQEYDGVCGLQTGDAAEYTVGSGDQSIERFALDPLPVVGCHKGLPIPRRRDSCDLQAQGKGNVDVVQVV